jgi:hypothetical protein
VKIERNDINKDILYCQVVASMQSPKFRVEDVDYSSFHLFIYKITRYTNYENWKTDWKYVTDQARDYMDEYVLNPLYKPDSFIFAKNLKTDGKHLFKVVTLRGELALVEDHGGFLDSGEILSLGAKRWIHLPSFAVSVVTEESLLEIARGGQVSGNVMGFIGVSKENLRDKLIITSKENHSKFIRSVAVDTATLAGVGLGIATAFKLAGSVVKSLVPPSQPHTNNIDESKTHSNQLEDTVMAAKGRTIVYKHNFTRDQLKDKIVQLVTDLTEKFPQYIKNLKEEPFDDPSIVYKASFNSDIIVGSVLITESNIEVNFDMKGFIYKAFAGVAETKIREVLEQDFKTVPELEKVSA